MISNRFVKRTVFVLCTAIFLNMSCSSNEGEKTNCDDSDLSVDTTPTQPTTCSATDGAIAVAGAGGKGPYKFSLNGAAFVETETFEDLAPGSYVITIRDNNGCERDEDVTLSAPGSTIDINLESDHAGCKTSAGAITVEATGGNAPYSYKLNEGAFGASSEFTGLASGNYTVTVKDADGCITTETRSIKSGVSYSKDIKPLLETRCVKCHGPDGQPGGSNPSLRWNSYDNVAGHASQIKSRTGNGSMPADGTTLTQEEKNMIACWVDDGAPNN